MQRNLPTTNLKNLREWVKSNDGLHSDPRETADARRAYRQALKARAVELYAAGLMDEVASLNARWQALGDEVQG